MELLKTSLLLLLLIVFNLVDLNQAARRPGRPGRPPQRPRPDIFKNVEVEVGTVTCECFFNLVAGENGDCRFSRGICPSPRGRRCSGEAEGVNLTGNSGNEYTLDISVANGRVTFTTCSVEQGSGGGSTSRPPRPTRPTRPSRPTRPTRPTGPTRPTPSTPSAPTTPSSNPTTSGSNTGGGFLQDSVITIRQTWSQETDYERTAKVRVPDRAGSFPVVIDLHGNGGQGNLDRFGRTLGDGVVLVAPDGYERSWNIIKEKSKAPDVEFILELINTVGNTIPVANMEDVTIIGTSNGAGMINRLLIEAPGPRPFHRVIPMVSMLIEDQYNNGKFWKRSNEASANYDEEVTPASPGPEFIYFHGTEDGACPYYGGRGILGLTFLSAQDATYTWASHWGETGQQLEDGQGIETDGGLVMYSYLEGRVVHFKAPGAGHGITGSQYNDEINELIKSAILGSTL